MSLDLFLSLILWIHRMQYFYGTSLKLKCRFISKAFPKGFFLSLKFFTFLNIFICLLYFHVNNDPFSSLLYNVPQMLLLIKHIKTLASISIFAGLLNKISKKTHFIFSHLMGILWHTTIILLLCRNFFFIPAARYLTLSLIIFVIRIIMCMCIDDGINAEGEERIRIHAIVWKRFWLCIKV